MNKRQSLILITFLLLILSTFSLGLHEYFTFENLKHHRETLQSFVLSHPVLSILTFMGTYIGVVLLSLPGGAILSITGGFLFGAFLGTFYIVISATIGATLLFLIAKSTLGHFLREKTGPWIDKLHKGFAENAFNYLLFLRLIPLFPFFVVNLVPAFLHVTTLTYTSATFIGIIPGAFVFASVGSGIGSIFDRGDHFTIQNILTKEITLALVALGCLSLLPILYKRFKKR